MIGNEPTGQWMRQSTMDNPAFLASKLSSFLLGWQRQRGVSGQGYASAPTLENLDAGHYLFARACATCHSIGQGDGLGPDLLGVTQRRNGDWLRRFIRAPEQLVEQKDPIALALFARFKQVQMPNLGLGEQDVEALIHYLDQAGAPPPAEDGAQPALAAP
ncbi:Cytochrome c [compost metagenome]